MIANWQVFGYTLDVEATESVDTLERIVVGAVAVTSRALAHAAPGTDLTFPQWRALLILGEDAAGARIGQVAARVEATLPATSRLLRRLERRGLVVLEPDELDRRATRARLTERGREVRGSILAFRRELLDAIARRLPEGRERPPGETIEALADAFGSYA